ncbi:MAG: dihydrofolate reductase [Prevotella sp.]|nr:dihydrofolate reductase [Prevotella sp.]
MTESDFCYTGERFADIQLLRYRLNGFEQLSLSQKRFIYCLAKATLYGRDITFNQFGKFNLLVRRTLEVIVEDLTIDHDNDEFRALHTYLKRVWFSNGIYHHYGCEKFVPGFTESYFRYILNKVESRKLPLADGQTVEELADILSRVIFDASYLPKRVNKTDGDDLVLTSACNYYEGVTQQEAEDYYNALKDGAGDNAPSFGLNSRLVKRDGQLFEEVYSAEGLYANPIKHIIYWLEKAMAFAENDKQRDVISTLVDYYRTGNLNTFDEYSIKWVECLEGRVDFINGFIEVYGDPLGLKASWEGIVEYTDLDATRRTRTISDNAQWFEDHSPVDSRFRKPVVKGVSANVICAAMLGGDEYPSTAIGINLPNADWIRAQHGSKSVTIGNLTEAYNKAAKGNGFLDEFAIDQSTIEMIRKYGDVCDDLHTDLHECLGHGSGQLLPGVSPDALKSYGSTIEEARADLFGLYYIADKKLIELQLLPDAEAYKSQYYSYIMNGLLTQIVRIAPGNKIEEAHMRNRALIAHWCLDNGNAISLVRREGKTYVQVNDYEELRHQFATLLAEIQRIKSEGDYEAARKMVETYGVNINLSLHTEILSRYKRLNIAPYKGFLNPRMIPVFNVQGDVTDITLDYSESYDEQMLRYSRQYGTLI